MRICDFSENEINIGMRVKSLISDKQGTIVSCDPAPSDPYWWILWDGEEKPYSGFYYNHCKCEVVEREIID